MKWNQFSLFRWTSLTACNNYSKELSWLYFDDEQKVQERQQVKNQEWQLVILQTPSAMSLTYRTNNEALRKTSNTQTFLWGLSTQNHSKPHITETRRNKTDNRPEIRWRYTNADLKFLLHARVHTKAIVWKFRILNPKNFRIICLWGLYFF